MIPPEIPAITTTLHGEILTANVEAVALLNVSERFLRGKRLVLFFTDRPSWLLTMRQLRESDPPIRRVAMVRPRDKRPQRRIALVSRHGDSIQWLFLADPRRVPRD